MTLLLSILLISLAYLFSKSVEVFEALFGLMKQDTHQLGVMNPCFCSIKSDCKVQNNKEYDEYPIGGHCSTSFYWIPTPTTHNRALNKPKKKGS